MRIFKKPVSQQQAVRRERFWPFDDSDFFAIDFPKIEPSEFLPAIDVSEDEKNFIVEADCPGFEKNQICVEFDRNELLISGEFSEDSDQKNKKMHRRERTQKSFFRSIALPPTANFDDAKCKFKNGTLKITVPKINKKSNKIIEIE